MTRFIGGPADGKGLALQRAPYFLRVVVKGKELDALDQLTDTPRPGELIYIYRRTAHNGRMHAYFGGGRGGWYEMAEYEFHHKQAADSEVRTTAAWQQWTRREAAEVKALREKESNQEP